MGFYFLYDFKILKNNPAFKYHYMIKHLIHDGDYIVDIGANLGYFSKNFVRLSPKGKVLSIEPIPMFYKALKRLLKKYKNVEVVHCALGNEEGVVTMVLPETNGMLRTGLPHIIDKDEKEVKNTAQVVVKKGSDLLRKLNKIDYIKCDIEGYEAVVFEELKNILKKHLPTVQIEISPKNVEAIFNLMEGLGYIQYGIANFKIVREQNRTQKEQGDYLFVHQDKVEDFEKEMKQKKVFDA